jgi:hypothetical protein
LLSKAEELLSDITYTGNNEFPYLLNLVVFNKDTLQYQAVAWVLCDKQDGESYATSFYEIFKYVIKNHPNFKNGKALKQIMVDFDDAEYNGFVEVLGKDIAEAVIRGCSVHWIRSVDRVADLVCKLQEESKMFLFNRNGEGF